MSRTPVIPLAMKSGSVTSLPPGTQSPKNVWMCMSQSPGMRNLPFPSTDARAFRDLRAAGLADRGDAVALDDDGHVRPRRTARRVDDRHVGDGDRDIGLERSRLARARAQEDSQDGDAQDLHVRRSYVFAGAGPPSRWKRVSIDTPRARESLSARSTDGVMRPASIAFTDLRVTPASAARSAWVRSRIAR